MVVLGCNISAILTYCVLELLKLSSITLLPVNIARGFSLGKNSCVHAVYIQLNLGNISCITARNSTTIETPEEIL